MLSSAFALGRVIEPARCVATGWGGHNRMWRLQTSRGAWAIKEVRRDLPSSIERSFGIEYDAVARGVPAPEPRLSTDGNVYAHVDGAVVRCHSWADGHAKTNETVTVDDAAAMGRIVAVLHGLRIVVPATPSGPSRRSFGEAYWLELAERGADAGAVWAERVRSNVAALMRVEGMLDRLPPARDRIGSHCDLNAHNVLFGQELMLIDWDGADAADPGFERASYAALWGSSTTGPPDSARTIAFLGGYLDGGGTLDPEDLDTLGGWMSGLLAWTEHNLQLALRGIGDNQHSAANALVGALINAPRTIEYRRAYLERCYAEVLG